VSVTDAPVPEEWIPHLVKGLIWSVLSLCPHGALLGRRDLQT
jgi:hypothetical protein